MNWPDGMPDYLEPEQIELLDTLAKYEEKNK